MTWPHWVGVVVRGYGADAVQKRSRRTMQGGQRVKNPLTALDLPLFDERFRPKDMTRAQLFSLVVPRHQWISSSQGYTSVYALSSRRQSLSYTLDITLLLAGRTPAYRRANRVARLVLVRHTLSALNAINRHDLFLPCFKG